MSQRANYITTKTAYYIDHGMDLIAARDAALYLADIFHPEPMSEAQCRAWAEYAKRHPLRQRADQLQAECQMDMDEDRDQEGAFR